MRRRALVPVRDLAGRRDHVDRVVGDALDQQPELFFALAQRIFGGLAFRDVARDLGETDEVAVAVPDRVDDHACPEPRAVLAHAPAFAFELALRHGRLERTSGFADRPVFLCIEDREVLADDLARHVAFETLRPRVPATDDAARVQQVDRVVADARDQQLEALLGRSTRKGAGPGARSDSVQGSSLLRERLRARLSGLRGTYCCAAGKVPRDARRGA